jgi:uncharacterized protein (DUF1330 family)
MPAYAIAVINVTDQSKYQEYARLAGPATAKFGGRFVARGGVDTVAEGNPACNRVVVVEFPSVAVAKAFYASSEYAEARAKRIGAAGFNMYIVEGS